MYNFDCKLKCHVKVLLGVKESVIMGEGNKMAMKKKEPIKRTIVSASGKKRTVVSKTKTAEKKTEEASEEIEEDSPKQTSNSRKASKAKARGFRIFAVILWLFAIACEVLVIMLLNGYFYAGENMTTFLIVGIALDLIFVVIGSLLWKHSNRLDPISKKNKLKFFLWNQMGFIVAVIAFLPLIIILMKDKKLDAKTKKLVTIIATVALVIAGLFSVDYNPVSSEDLVAAEEQAVIENDGIVNWTRFGSSYHYDVDCHTLSRSSVIYEGSIDEAFEAHRTDPCDFCVKETNE